MRKHFLILMLLTLLPMASWADAITGYTAVFDDMVYTGVEQNLPAPTKLQKGLDEITVGIHATDWKKGGVSVTKILDAGEYTCTVQADGYDGTITATLTVAKSVVTVTGVNIPEAAGITFGDPKSEVEALYDAEYAFDGDLELDDAAKEALEAQFDAQLTFATNYDQWVDIAAFYVRPVIDALESTFTNYTFEPVDGALTVSPKTFTADLISSIADITYTAADLEDGIPARITLKDGTYVIDGEDFNYAYSKGGADVDHVKNAGTYTVTLTANANTNYTGSASKEFVVKRLVCSLPLWTLMIRFMMQMVLPLQ